MLCVICNEIIKTEINGWDRGHNAEPVKSGRCCSACKKGVVIPKQSSKCRKENKKI
jgi:hypothetical protein